MTDCTRNSERSRRSLVAGTPRGSQSECFFVLARRGLQAVRCGNFRLRKGHVEGFPHRNRDHRHSTAARMPHQGCRQQTVPTGDRWNRQTKRSKVLDGYLDRCECPPQAPLPRRQSFPSRRFRVDGPGYPPKDRSSGHQYRRWVNPLDSLPGYYHCPTLPHRSVHYCLIVW